MSHERPPLRDVWEHYIGPANSKKTQLCPFHTDSQPSCSVDWDTGLWHCFSCGAGGDTWTFIQKQEGVEFKDAVRIAESNGFESKPEVRTSRWGTTIPARKSDGKRKKFRPTFRR